MKIVYIAPEIPGLSSTFVYNEIFDLEQREFEVLPISIHPAIKEPPTSALQALKDKALLAYNRGFFKLFADNIIAFFKHPFRYISTLSNALLDSVKYINRPVVSGGIIYRFFVSASVSLDIEHWNAEHIHCHFAHFPADIAMYASGLTGIPFSVTAHANDIFCNSWLLCQKSNRSKFIATISDYNREYLKKSGCQADKIQIIRCGVIVPDTTNTNPSPNRKPETLGFLGRIVEKKGLDTLINACSILNKRGVDFRLEIVGDGPLLNAHKSISTVLGLDDQLVFRGNMNNDQISSWLEQIDIFVLPCKIDKDGDMDGIPVAIMEAMLEGIPVVSTTISGIPELVINNKTGILCRPDDPEDLSEKIISLISSEELQRELAAQGIEHIRKNFNRKKNSELLSQLFVQ